MPVEEGDILVVERAIVFVLARPENWFQCIGPHMRYFDGKPVYECDTNDSCRCEPTEGWWLGHPEGDGGMIEAFDLETVEYHHATAIDRLAALTENV